MGDIRYTYQYRVSELYPLPSIMKDNFGNWMCFHPRAGKVSRQR
jgi:hypothetical protein